MPLPRLPISPALPAITESLGEGRLVLGAPPGSGKTTLVPLALLDAPWLAGRRIIMLEPRRPAARMAARRMAELLGEAVGETVGYQVRFERRIGPRTRIEVLTEGLLLRRLQADPELDGVGLVIFDEFHERSLTADLSLALCLDAASGLRDDLHLLLMSASLEGEALARRLQAAHLQAEGRAHPVEIHHLERDPAPEDHLRELARLSTRALREHDGDLLVFLPGRGEIERLAGLLEDRLPPGCRLQRLHGEIPPAEQDRVIRGGEDGRRVILSTDIAETSLTIEGITVVVDGGLQRRPRFDPASGLERLETAFISRASALQRAGRAGRLGPGHCYRAWSRAREQRMEAGIRPEILDADLAGCVLELAGWGVTDPADLCWVTAPPAAHWAQARALLTQLDAVDGAGRITPSGRAMLGLPLHPRLAHMLSQAPAAGQARAADIAALLSERDPAPRGSGADLQPRLDALDALRSDRDTGGMPRAALGRIERVSRQLRGLLRGPAPDGPAPSPGALLALAYPDRVAQARAPDSGDYLLRNGRAASLRPDDPLRGTPFLVAVALDAGREQGRIWLAARIGGDEIEALFGPHIEETIETAWDDQAQAARGWHRRRLGALVLSERNTTVEAQQALPLLLEQVRHHGLGLFEQAGALRQQQGRVALLRRHGLVDDWPAIDDQTLLQSLETWLAPWLDGVTSLARLRRVDILAALQAHLGWERWQRLEQLLPTHYQTPAGTRRPIEYPGDGEPVLRVPLQEMLGERESPRLAGGRIPVLLHLLSPAMRPLQITRDLAHFWANAYAEVRKEMRGRYPKHHWPEDPLAASATRLGRRRP